MGVNVKLFQVNLLYFLKFKTLILRRTALLRDLPTLVLTSNKLYILLVSSCLWYILFFKSLSQSSHISRATPRPNIVEKSTREKGESILSSGLTVVSIELLQLFL